MFSCAAPRQTPAPIENASISSNSVTVSSPGAAKPIKVVDNSAPVQTQIAKLNDDDTTTAQPVVTEQEPVPKSTTVMPQSSELKPVVAAAATGAVIGGINWLNPIGSNKIIKQYSAADKGIDIGGVGGSPIIASDDGVVAYSGKGPDGYGLLVIIKHKNNYLTAYSHNKVNLVKKDDVVKRGQKIAEVGQTDAKEPMLHYELRQHGKPIDPTKIFK